MKMIRTDYGRDGYFKGTELLESFILPLDLPKSYNSEHRRLERAMVGMKGPRPLTLQYVNRLSDWIFVMTRWVSYRLGEEILDSKGKEKNRNDKASKKSLI